MLRFALAFLLGDVWVQCLPTLTNHQLLLPIVVAFALYALPLSRSYLTGSGIVAFIAGLGWTVFCAHTQLQQDLDAAYEGRDLNVTGYIASIPEIEPYGVRFAFVVTAAEVKLPQRLELTWYGPATAIHAADRWCFTVRLKRRHGFANPGGYDYEAQLFRDGVGATGYVRDADANRSLGQVAGERVLKLRAALTEAIANAIPHAAMQGVVRGLAVGDQQAIGSDAWQVFARTGTSHLMAISGFHIGMVAWVFAWLGSRLIYLPMAQRWRWTKPDLRALFGMSAALGYSLLAGMSVPTQRTLIMLAVYFGAGVLRRELTVWHSFGVALLLVLIVDPFAPMAVGAWLSFGAVAVILLNQVGRVGHGSTGREFLNMQAIVSLGLVPLLLSSFGSLSLVSPLVNLLAIPLFTAVLVPLVLIGCALLLVHASVAAWWLGWLAQGLDWVFAGLQWAANLSWANWYAAEAPLWAMGWLVLGTIMLVLPWLWPLRASGLLCCLPALCWQAPPVPQGGFTMTTLDVGQGLAVVIATRTHTLLYDTGPSFQSGHDTGELVVLPYLRSQGVRHLNRVMISHGDDDHVGGLRSVLNGLPVGDALLGPSVKMPVVPSIQGSSLHSATCSRGQQWQWDGVTFEVVHPDLQHLEPSDNNQSCVLRVSGAGGSVLLLGDVEKAVEHELVASNLLTPTSIVEAAHHGSRSSSTQALVDATHPQWTIFSAGYRNRWGFPKQEVVARWQVAGAGTVSTIEAGAVTAKLWPGQPIDVQRYRQPRRHYWQGS